MCVVVAAGQLLSAAPLARGVTGRNRGESLLALSAYNRVIEEVFKLGERYERSFTPIGRWRGDRRLAPPRASGKAANDSGLQFSDSYQFASSRRRLIRLKQK
ncbi:hypothetical protein E6C76_19320 [Pseudothauera nasutitermitis]|uniref:Uncharacterized protein n=1 Tax=Pseudothauera nasutitermitis TaxID=2565930 RepID=A0A4S4AQ75_9RHOO|nr:hypothetical protein [Pseudothauera nasutitermitis]THF61813.1 hypothetical protein E6C76_19320 [Pseudothauera nasutitermitis]